VNKDRRKSIEAIADQLSKIEDILNQHSIDFGSLQSEIEGLKDEEQEYYDNMPESLQGGDKGQAAEEAVGYLESAYDKLGEINDAFEKLGEVVEELRNAAGV
jgi:chromosome segregation ATPase